MTKLCSLVDTLREILGMRSSKQRVEFAIKCALAVYNEPDFSVWADAWLSGRDRSLSAAVMARSMMRNKTTAPGAARAVSAARWAAGAAEMAAHRLKWVAEANSMYAENVSQALTLYAAYAADSAIESDPELDIAAIAENVLGAW